MQAEVFSGEMSVIIYFQVAHKPTIRTDRANKTVLVIKWWYSGVHGTIFQLLCIFNVFNN